MAADLRELAAGDFSLELRTAAVISPWTAGLREPRMAADLRDSRPTDSRHSRRSHQTPGPNISRPRREDERQLPCRETDRNKQKTIKINKTKRGEWAPLTV